MKKILPLLALMLLLVPAIPIPLASATMVDHIVYHEVNNFVVDLGPDGYYEVMDVFHTVIHVTDKEDGTYLYTLKDAYIETATGDGIYGTFDDDTIVKVQSKHSFNVMVGNDFVETLKYKIQDVWGYYYQLVLVYANGEIRVYHERISS